jgi:GT2 family glycosyltransferase
MKKVSIITVNYNGKLVTEELLYSLQHINTYPNLEVIVVDNASRENPVPEWQKKYPHYTFIRAEENEGFAAGNNLGIDAATGDFLFFINNDTIVTPTLIAQMVEAMEANEKIGLLSPKIMYHEKPNIIQYCGFTPMNFYTCRNACIGQYEEDKGQYNAASGTTGYVHGAAMMARKEHIALVGKMPENFFLYYEEGDWCEMFKRKQLDIQVLTTAVIYHKESMAVGKNSVLKEYFITRNRILFIRRNAWFYQNFVFLLYFFLVVTPKKIIGFAIKREWKFIVAFIQAVWWNLTNSRTSDFLYIPKY